MMVGLGRVELPTSPLSGARSSQLSYRPSCFAGAADKCQSSFAARPAASFSAATQRALTKRRKARAHSNGNNADDTSRRLGSPVPIRILSKTRYSLWEREPSQNQIVVRAGVVSDP